MLNKSTSKNHQLCTSGPTTISGLRYGVLQCFPQSLRDTQKVVLNTVLALNFQELSLLERYLDTQPEYTSSIQLLCPTPSMLSTSTVFGTSLSTTVCGDHESFSMYVGGHELRGGGVELHLRGHGRQGRTGLPPPPRLQALPRRQPRRQPVLVGTPVLNSLHQCSAARYTATTTVLLVDREIHQFSV